MKVLKLGSYIIPAYAGMVLAEQGHTVVKWVGQRPDPVQELAAGGDDLWAWINHGKTVVARHASDVAGLPPGHVDIVIDNIRAATWQRWGIDPAVEAERLGVTWVSMRADEGERSFDVIAQARAWGDHLGLLPAYLGDTAGGLWMAFKALAAPRGHHVLYQATCLAKLVEGELVVPVARDGRGSPWDEPGTYGPDDSGAARVHYRGHTVREPLRDDEWRWHHLVHDEDGRYAV